MKWRSNDCSLLVQSILVDSMLSFTLLVVVCMQTGHSADNTQKSNRWCAECVIRNELCNEAKHFSWHSFENCEKSLVSYRIKRKSGFVWNDICQMMAIVHNDASNNAFNGIIYWHLLKLLRLNLMHSRQKLVTPNNLKLRKKWMCCN